MEFTAIRFAYEGDVARLTLARPDRGNAINVRMVQELEQAFERLEDESKARVLVLDAAGDDFSVGIDLIDFPVDAKPDVHGFSRWERACRTLERLPLLTIAAIDGRCVGGGLQLALDCDLRIATDRSVFALHEVRMGFLPGTGTFRLAKYVGLGRARRMATTGREVESKEAMAMGLVDRVCAAKSLGEAVDAALAEVEGLDRRTVQLIRRLLDESYELSYEDYVGNFLAAQHMAIQWEPFRERVRRAHATGLPHGDDTDS